MNVSLLMAFVITGGTTRSPERVAIFLAVTPLEDRAMDISTTTKINPSNKEYEPLPDGNNNR